MDKRTRRMGDLRRRLTEGDRGAAAEALVGRRRAARVALVQPARGEWRVQDGEQVAAPSMPTGASSAAVVEEEPAAEAVVAVEVAVVAEGVAAAVGAAAAAAHSCESIVYVLIPPQNTTQHTAHGSLSRSKHAEALL